jgi:rod shape-determining protein MreD
MLYYILTPLLLILLIVIQQTLSSMCLHGFLNLEISLIVVIYAGFHLDLLKGVFLSFVAGFIIDCVGGFIPGASSFIYVLIFLGSFFVSEFLDTGKNYVIMSFAFVCVLLKEMLLLSFYSMTLGTNVFAGGYKAVFAQSLIAACFAPAVFYGMRRLGEVVYENQP